MCNWKLLTQSYSTLCDPMDCSPPGSSVQGILQARILEWVAISFSRGSSQPRDWTQVSCIAGRLYRLRQPGVIGLLISKNCFWYNFYQRVVISYKFSEGQVFCLPISMICVCAFATQSCLTLCKPMDCSPKGSCVHGILRQEYWSGLSFPSAGDLLTQGLNLGLPRCRQTHICISYNYDHKLVK